MRVQLRTIHAGHVDVEQDAAGPRDRERIQEGLRGAERLHLPAIRPQQAVEGVTHLRVVIDDEDRGLLVLHAISRDDDAAKLAASTDDLYA